MYILIRFDLVIQFKKTIHTNMTTKFYPFYDLLHLIFSENHSSLNKFKIIFRPDYHSLKSSLDCYKTLWTKNIGKP